jgi:outer membrane protein assembly factor BamB
MRSRKSLTVVSAVALAVALAPTLPAAGVSAQGSAGHRASHLVINPGDWDMWGYNQQRTGFNPNETTLSPATVPGLHLQWQFPYAATSDNAPVFASDVEVGQTPTDIVYAGDRTGEFYAIDAATGSVLWSHDLGTIATACFGTLGATSTAFIDRSTNLIYAVGGSGALYAMDLGTGAVQAGWPVQITQFPNEYVWSALAEENGELYAPVASGCDRGGTYYGRIARVNAASATVDANFYVTDGPTTGVSGGGVWGWGGVSIDSTTGDVFEASGNGVPVKPYEHFLYAESVARLGSDLTLKASNYPGLVGNDVDFGSTPILFTARKSCGQQLFVMNKDGEVLLYSADDIASGPVDEAQVSSKELIGVAAYSPADHRIYMGNSADSADGVYKRGLLAFRVGTDCKLRLSWNRRYKIRGPSASPVSANGVLYWGNGSGDTLTAFDLATRRPIWSQSFDDGPMTEPIVVGGHVYVSVGDSLYAFGL